MPQACFGSTWLSPVTPLLLGAWVAIAGCSSSSTTLERGSGGAGGSSGGSAGSTSGGAAGDGGAAGSSSTVGGNAGQANGGAAGGGNGGSSGAAGSAGAGNGGSGNGGSGGSATGGSAGTASGGAGGAAGGGGISCPPGMAAIANTFCMDRWELKLGLPFAPTSAPNQTPITNYKPKTFRGNCENAGKRLCTLEELASACSNGNTTLYPYGSSYTEAACGDSGLHATGALNSCVNADQVYDLVGNVWELAEFGTDSYATLFGGDHRRDGAATFSCCIRTQPGNAYPAGCEALYDASDSLDHGTNTTSVDVDAFTHTKDVYDRDIDMGYRCCSDPL